MEEFHPRTICCPNLPHLSTPEGEHTTLDPYQFSPTSTRTPVRETRPSYHLRPLATPTKFSPTSTPYTSQGDPRNKPPGSSRNYPSSSRRRTQIQRVLTRWYRLSCCDGGNAQDRVRGGRVDEVAVPGSPLSRVVEYTHGRIVTMGIIIGSCVPEPVEQIDTAYRVLYGAVTLRHPGLLDLIISRLNLVVRSISPQLTKYSSERDGTCSVVLVILRELCFLGDGEFVNINKPAMNLHGNECLEKLGVDIFEAEMIFASRFVACQRPDALLLEPIAVNSTTPPNHPLRPLRRLLR
uniref:Uncharacterized protein n=1 Tax=Timema douglasi TaxID=61478 RepID=A0A7R8VMT9_TIMDO|nr:unnamed protein product [Timema douglasi]